MDIRDYLSQSCAQSRDELVQQGQLKEEVPYLELEQIERLASYLDLLQRWTKKVDLVSPGDKKALIKRHIIDSYAAALLLDSHLPQTAIDGILDVGSGAGLPGFVLAIAYPGRSIMLCEPRAKRCVFLKEVVRELALERVAVLQARMEDLSPEQVSTAKLSVCRALGKSKDFISNTFRLLGPDSMAAEMLGPNWPVETQKSEMQGLATLESVASYSLSIPGSSRNIAFWRSSVD
jgi:16S rRNA (guanine527-N7)-methyltransferase